MAHEDLRELEDKVAERIWAVMKPLRNDPRPWSSVGHESRGPFLEAAKDAIRMVKREVMMEAETRRREVDGGS